MSQILEMHEKGMTYEEIAQALGLSYKQVNHAINNARKKQKVQFDDKKDEPTPEDIDRLYAALVNYDQALGATDTKQTKATIRIDDSKPIGIAFWGDWHLIARGMDFQQFDKDKQAISDTDGLFFVGMGDYKDNYKPGMGRASGGMLEQIASPGVQDLLVKKVIEDTAHKCISLIRGCHDDWDKHSADKDFISTLCEIADLDAVEMVIEICQRHYPDVYKAVKIVYLNDPGKELEWGDIQRRVHDAELTIPASERQVYYWLRKARLLFAEERGLRKKEVSHG